LKLSNSEIRNITITEWKFWACTLPNFTDSFYSEDNGSLKGQYCDLDQTHSVQCGKLNYSNSVKHLCFNLRSLKDVKKKCFITSWLTAVVPTIICINETWLNSNITTAEVIDDSSTLF
jgi:hypothetical protein